MLSMPPLYVQRRVVPLSHGLSLLFASVCVSCVWSQQPNTDPPPSKPAPEMHRLAAALGGRWTIRQQFEPHQAVPNGDTGSGTEVWRPGPGARSLIEDIHTKRPGRPEATIWPAEKSGIVAREFIIHLRFHGLANLDERKN